ncbi:histidine kinase N-terminal 7TM domain-containing protein [Cohnella sp.]|uniref:sensor histidine kinase n=1 Tax=Cohnella sp. TaxID=1883426 RepID=UPI0037049398
MDIKQWMSIFLFAAAAIMLFISWLAYRKRHLPVAKTVFFMMLAAAFYAFGYGLEVLSRTLDEFKLSLQIEYLGIPFSSTLWLLLVIQFAGIAAKRRKQLAVALMIIPALVFGFHLTNDWHHLVYERYILNTDSEVPLYTTIKGFWYKVHGAYNYGVMLFGMLLFIPLYWRSPSLMRKQIVILAFGGAAPMLLNAVFWFGIRVDLTPFGFVVSGIVYVWGIYRFNLLRLMPLAQAKLFDTIRDGVVLIDGDDRIVSFNRAAASVIGELSGIARYPAETAVALSAHPELLESIRGAGSGEAQFPFRRTDGERTRYYACSLTPIMEADAQPIGKILMLNDITELKENEARLRENARQLVELNTFKDKLFTVVAHDIRDPIALLVSLTELLGEELTAAGREHAELFLELKDQVNGTFHLVEQLLDWYRSQKGQIVFSPMSWNLQQVVRQALALAGAKSGIKRIDLTENIDARLAVRADKEMLDLILRNLLSNAIKYTGIGGSIEVGASQEGESVVVSVRDNGAGIDPDISELLRLEEPFFKPPVHGDESLNARFGLVLAREFVRIHGGRLWFDSVPEEGTTFYFSLAGFAGGLAEFVEGDREGESG